MARRKKLAFVALAATLFMTAYALADSRVFRGGIVSPHAPDFSKSLNIAGENTFLASSAIGAPLFYKGHIAGYIDDIWIDNKNEVTKITFRKSPAAANAADKPLFMAAFKSIAVSVKDGSPHFSLGSAKAIEQAPQDPYSLGLMTTYRDFLREDAGLADGESVVHMRDMLIATNGHIAFAIADTVADSGDTRLKPKDYKIVSVSKILPLECGGGFLVDLTHQQWRRLPSLETLQSSV